MKNSLYLFALIAFTACEDSATDLIDERPAVISAYLYAGNNLDSIRITESNSYFGDGILQTIDDISVSVFSHEDTVELNSKGNGYYGSDDYIIEAGKEYGITFNWNDEKVSALTFVPETNEAEISDTVLYMEKTTGGFGGFGGFNLNAINLEVSWSNPDGEYYFILIENLEESPEYINEFFQNLVSQGDTLQRPFIRTEPEVTDFKPINTRRDIQEFGRHRVIVYRLNPEYAALYESVGTSSISLVSAPSNVINGHGIFTGISTDTLYFEVIKI